MRFVPAARKIGILFLLLVFVCGCSTRHKVEQAQHLEDQGKYLEAAALYKQLASHYRGQPQKESLLQARLGEVLLRAGACWIQPPRIKHTVLEYSDDCEVLEIIMPAEFETVMLD